MIIRGLPWSTILSKPRRLITRLLMCQNAAHCYLNMAGHIARPVEADFTAHIPLCVAVFLPVVAKCHICILDQLGPHSCGLCPSKRAHQKHPI